MLRSAAITSVATALFAFVALVGASAVAGCADDKPGMVPFDPSKRQTPAADIAELEIRANGVDRFTRCPPPGRLGDPWFPKPRPWTPPAPTEPTAPAVIDSDYMSRVGDQSPAERAIEATHRDFRSCYRRGLVHDPTADGRAAFVLRVGADGKVARVEEYGACEIAVESIQCMKSVAARLRFPPPAGGTDAVIIPAMFTSRDGVRLNSNSGSPNDVYTAGAYLKLEDARPGLHACEEQARRELKPLEATGTFTMTLGKDGQVTAAHVDPWTGEQSILICAARELEKLKFSPPPSGMGTVIARLNFNPRQGSR